MNNLLITVLVLDLIYMMNNCSPANIWQSIQEIGRELVLREKRFFLKQTEMPKMIKPTPYADQIIDNREGVQWCAKKLRARLSPTNQTFFVSPETL